ncbi:MAG: ATP:cob(I)alamin adenosyltransferase, partial [Dongiaceae bacterium]
MVRLTRIYTKSGDKGTTALGTGKRVPKHDRRVEAYGTVDEANAAVGLARIHAAGGGEAMAAADEMLARIQNDLFDLGADLCAPEGDDGKERLRIIEAQVERLERETD